jgi:hypothetical protein
VGQAAKKTSENLRWLALSACPHDGSRRAPREQGAAPAAVPPDGLPGAMTRMISDKKLQPFSCSPDDAGRCGDAAAREPVMNFLEGSRKRFPMQRRRRDDFAAIFTNATRGRADAHPERLADVPHSGSLTAEHSARRRGWGGQRADAAAPRPRPAVRPGSPGQEPRLAAMAATKGLQFWDQCSADDGWLRSCHGTRRPDAGTDGRRWKPLSLSRPAIGSTAPLFQQLLMARPATTGG